MLPPPVDWSTALTHAGSAISAGASFLGGGFVSGVLNMINTGRRAKRDLALRLAEEFLKRNAEFNAAGQLIPTNQELPPDDLAKIDAAGNWLEVVATLYKDRALDRGLFKALGIDQVISGFATGLNQSPALEERLKQWINIASFGANKGGN